MYMNDVKEFKVKYVDMWIYGFDEEMYFSNSATSLVYSQHIILVKRGNLKSLMFLKSI